MQAGVNHASGNIVASFFVFLTAWPLFLQKNVRRWITRRKYQRDVACVIVAQSAVRRWFAKKQLRKLKIEAKSVEHVKKLNKGLEKKIISLQQKIEELVSLTFSI